MDEILTPGRLRLPQHIAADLEPDFNLDLTKKHQPPTTHHPVHQNAPAIPDHIVIDQHTRIIIAKLVKRTIAVVSDSPKTLVLHCELLRMPNDHPSDNNECIIKIRRQTLLERRVRREVIEEIEHRIYYDGRLVWVERRGDEDSLVHTRVRQEVKQRTLGEWANLGRMKNAQIRVPEVYFIRHHVLFMSVLKDKRTGAPMKRLSDVEAGLDHAKEVDIYRQVVAMMQRSYNVAELIHTRIVESNILLDEEDRCWFVDVGTVVDRSHPDADDLLEGVCEQVEELFTKRGLAEVLPKDELLQHITGTSSTERQP